ncbi:MAG: ammonium transporter [Oscillospiraceae bacterium]|nr:ammonium transporter [Oscillospiraceae bacterium]
MYSSANTIWVLVASALVFFMQAGFAMVETGFTRAKNAGNIIMKNLMDFAIGTPIFWIVGFGLMFGAGSSLLGGFDLFTRSDYAAILPQGVPFWAYFIFQTVFCATAATIVSGAMAERTKFLSYCIYSAVISAVIYPISGRWIWSASGWLAGLGFHDFAGSTAVHMVGGLAALIGASILGPRIGKYDETGKPRAIPGHSLTLGALGVFILWFCWFGFNGGSTVNAEGEALVTMGSVFFTTNLAAAVATVTVMIFTWLRYGKPDVSMTLNGSLAGLVAITAGCDVMDGFGAFFTGILAGFTVVFGVEFVEKKLKIDDPVGAVGVHCMCGALGTLLVGLFDTQRGVFYGGGVGALGIQALGVVSVAAWVGVTTFLLFKLIDKTVGLRCTAAEEIAGLDISEHGLTASYADFMPQYHPETGESAPASVQAAVPVEFKPSPAPAAVGAARMTKIEIITKQSRFEQLKRAMDELGITGMTVTQVLGCGMQKGQPEYYRGVALETTLLPKICVEIVVCKLPVSAVVNAAVHALYTGHIGDGKIFVSNIESVVKIRTGETDYDALQDEENIPDSAF